MRESRVLKKLRKNEPVICGKSNISSPWITEMIGMAGYDCVWLCMEHCPASYKDIEDCVRAGKIYDMDAAVRVNKSGYSDIIKPLELDATGIIYPHCKSKEEAGQLVKNTKFYPLGCRPVDGGNIDGSYCNLPFKEYIAKSNENKFVMAQIEDKEAIDEIDEIVKVDGIDIIFIGPGDLSQSFGIPGEMNNSTIAGAIDKIANTCKKYNKPCSAIHT